MKILIVMPYFYPAQYFGGPVQAVFKVGRELVKRNHEVVVFTSDAKDLQNRLNIETSEIEGMKICYFKNMSMLFPKLSRLFITPKLAKEMRSELRDFDVIYANEYTTFQNIIVHKIAKEYEVPYVVQTRGSLPKIGRQARKRLYDVLFGFRLLRDASMVVALTRSEFRQCQTMGVTKEKIAVVPNGIDLSQYAFLPTRGSFRKKHHIPENVKIILYLGRIHKIKGVDVLVKAYASAKKSIGNSLLVICGSDDGYLDKLTNLISSLKLVDNVLLTGPLYGKDKLEAYVDSDAFVLPSRYETFPNVVLEAYACGKPVIASNVESISDIVIDGKTGFLFEANRVKGLAEMLLYVLSNLDEAEKMGKKARAFAEQYFSIDRVVDSLENLFKEVVNQ